MRCGNGQQAAAEAAAAQTHQRAAPSARPGTTRQPEGSPGPGLPRMCEGGAREAEGAGLRLSPAPSAAPWHTALSAAPHAV